ncbi:phospholipase A2 [Streptomyces sp. MZ04]|uniref:phospholipase A2 n=1 Tax=Streptomyces sp. MZ04 TaxID=2559236 RepID=UPI00107EB05A|nr:phospholipase A2 [Streptomyces sp. MZ04]TGA98403.1 phospholipase [Streptomyces sp. MZ04]
MVITRIAVASLAAAGALVAGSGMAQATPEPSPAVTASAADGADSAAGGPGKMRRLYELTRSTETSVKDWRKTRKLAKAGVDRWNFRWDTDWCTRLDDKPGGFDFRLPCARHDFGYRNYKQLIGKKAFAGSKHERRVDKAFLFDMNRQCATQAHKTKTERAQCRKKAKAYYDRVS